MKIAILGGGITGLTAAYCLAKKNHQVVVFEKENVLGGLASGFKSESWDWYLEKTYHHLFANDSDVLNFAKEIGFDKIFFKAPETASLYSISKIKDKKSKIQIKNQKYSINLLDTPIDLLKFPYLNIIDKLRAGAVIACLKLSPFFSFYERQTAEKFLKKTMGEKVWNVLWQQLFRGKYGDYAGIILASFIWARIKKRTKKLGYIEGGFQAFINYLESELTLNHKGFRASVLTGYEIKEINKRGEKYVIDNQIFDAVISTLPTPVLIKISQKVFLKSYLKQLSKIKYLHALTLILETDKPILEKTYWLNICTDKIPFMILAQHTNFADKRNYNNNHLAYIGWYLNSDNKLLKMEKEEIVKFVEPHLKILNSKFLILNSFLFQAQFAQPIFDKIFIENKPDFITPEKNFYIANLDMTYPYDRGVNYAVKLGKEVSKFIQ
jgi:protoporphyrinogen oxidase